MVTLSKITINSVDYEFSFISANLSGTIPTEHSTKGNQLDYTTFVEHVPNFFEKSINITVGLHTDGVSTATVKTFALLEAMRQFLNTFMTLTLNLDGGALQKVYTGKIWAQHQTGIISTSPSQNLFSFNFILTGVSW